MQLDASKRARMLERLRDENPEALLCDDLEPALVGIVTRGIQPTVALYSKARAVEYFMRDGANYEDAIEHLEFNTWGAWVGPHTPCWLDDLDDLEEA